MLFTERFNEILEQEKINQNALAAAVGVSKQCITDYKKGRTYPSLDTLILLCDFLGVSSDYLLGLEDDFGVSNNSYSMQKHSQAKEVEKSLRNPDFLKEFEQDNFFQQFVKLYHLMSEVQKGIFLAYVITTLKKSGVNTVPYIGY